MNKFLKYSKFDVRYYFDFYKDLINCKNKIIYDKFLKSLRNTSIICLDSIKRCYLNNLDFDTYFSWHTAFYLRRKFYIMKENFEKFKVRFY